MNPQDKELLFGCAFGVILIVFAAGLYWAVGSFLKVL